MCVDSVHLARAREHIVFPIVSSGNSDLRDSGNSEPSNCASEMTSSHSGPTLLELSFGRETLNSISSRRISCGVSFCLVCHRQAKTVVLRPIGLRLGAGLLQVYLTERSVGTARCQRLASPERWAS